MSRLVILAAVVTLAISSANCANSPDQANVFGPSALDAGGGVSGPAGKGGGGGKGKPGGGGTTGGSGSLALKMVTDVNADGLPNWGDSVSFDVSTTATTQPHVSLTCTQNGSVVYGASTGYYASYPWPWTQIMTLQSSSWQSGAASCTAKLYYINVTTTVDLASISFTAGA